MKTTANVLGQNADGPPRRAALLDCQGREAHPDRRLSAWFRLLPLALTSIEASDLAAPDRWLSLATISVTDTPHVWRDTAALNSPRRFYRAVLLP